MAVPDAPPRGGAASLAPARAVFVTRDGMLPRSSSVQHWQLRDLVACPTPGALYVVRHCSILRYSLKDGKVSVGGGGAHRAIQSLWWGGRLCVSSAADRRQ